jgi:hypothetical protein
MRKVEEENNAGAEYTVGDRPLLETSERHDLLETAARLTSSDKVEEKVVGHPQAAVREWQRNEPKHPVKQSSAYDALWSARVSTFETDQSSLVLVRIRQVHPVEA